MDKISWYHLQHGDEIKVGDEYYRNHSVLGPRWHTIAGEYVGKKYDAANMQPIRRKREVEDDKSN